jgi:hypothetical protein
MSYGVKYIASVPSKNGLTYILEISEKDYSSGSTPVNAGVNPFTLNYYSTDDDVFTPIIGSELAFDLEVTDNNINIDLFSDDDTKYLVKLYASTNTLSYYDFLIWQGFLLVNDIQLPFTTGLRFMSFKAVDGLGLLKNINYNANLVMPDNESQLRSLLDVILGCLNQMGLPDFFLNIQCSIYANGMVDRTTDSSAEPFSQSYTRIRSWFQEPDVYKNCYEILSDIMIAFGCNLFQSNGQYVVSQVNERSDNTVWLTKYDNLGAVVASGQFANKRFIKGYSLSAQNYFIDNEQVKYLKKGFNVLEIEQEIKYAENLWYNKDFQQEYLGQPFGWNTSAGFFSGNTALATALDFNCRVLYYSGADITGGVSMGTGGTNNTFTAFQNEIYEIGFDMVVTPAVLGKPVALRLIIYIVQNATVAWYYNIQNNEWKIGLLSNIVDYGNEITVDNDTELWKRLTYNLGLSPITGELKVTFSLGVAIPSIPLSTTKEEVRLKNAVLKGINNDKEKVSKIVTKAERGANNSYKKNVTVSVGVTPRISNNMINGVLQNASGVPLIDWYRLNSSGIIFDSLIKLLAQNYINAVAKNSITLQGKIFGLYTNKIGDGVTTFEYLDSCKVDDNAGDPYEVVTKKYVLGNATFDFYDNTLSGNLLQTGNEELAATITEETIYK